MTGVDPHQVFVTDRFRGGYATYTALATQRDAGP
jgi:hypothetical protein